MPYLRIVLILYMGEARTKGALAEFWAWHMVVFVKDLSRPKHGLSGVNPFLTLGG